MQAVGEAATGEVALERARATAARSKSRHGRRARNRWSACCCHPLIADTACADVGELRGVWQGLPVYAPAAPRAESIAPRGLRDRASARCRLASSSCSSPSPRARSRTPPAVPPRRQRPEWLAGPGAPRLPRLPKDRRSPHRPRSPSPGGGPRWRQAARNWSGGHPRVRLKDAQGSWARSIREDASVWSWSSPVACGSSCRCLGWRRWKSQRVPTQRRDVATRDPIGRHSSSRQRHDARGREGRPRPVGAGHRQAAYGVHDNVSVMVGATDPASFAAPTVSTCSRRRRSAAPSTVPAPGGIGVRHLRPGVGLGAAASVSARSPSAIRTCMPRFRWDPVCGRLGYRLLLLHQQPDLTLSGNWRVRRNVALITELVHHLDDLVQVVRADALGARFMSDRIALDLGGVFFFYN